MNKESYRQVKAFVKDEKKLGNAEKGSLEVVTPRRLELR